MSNNRSMEKSKMSHIFEDKENLILLKDLLNFSQKQLGFKKPPRLFIINDKENAQEKLSKTAYYDPEKKSIFVYVISRHIKDILRSVSHEIVHYNQDLCGQMKNTSDTPEGYAQSNPHLRELEREAYEKGNLIFRDWTDAQTKERKQKVKQMNESKEKKEFDINPLTRDKANDHYVKRADKVFDELMGRWGFKKKPAKEEPDNEKKNS